MILDDLMGELLDPHAEKIKRCIADNLLEETIGVVLECIANEVQSGKIRMEGVLDRDAIMERCMDYLKLKREA